LSCCLYFITAATIIGGEVLIITFFLALLFGDLSLVGLALDLVD